MSNEKQVEGIRLAYVHLSVTTPRRSVRVPAQRAPSRRDAALGRWGHTARPRSSDRPTGLAA